MLLLSSCATTTTVLEGDTLNVLNESFSRICLNGQGKARFTADKQKMVFGYESLWEEKKGKEEMMFSVTPPFQEPILLKARYDKNKLIPKFSGAFFKELKKQFPPGSIEYKIFLRILSRMGVFYKLASLKPAQREAILENCKSNGESQDIRSGICPMRYPFKFSITPEKASFVFKAGATPIQLDLSKMDIGHYSRFVMTASTPGSRKRSVKAEFFINQCL